MTDSLIWIIVLILYIAIFVPLFGLSKSKDEIIELVIGVIILPIIAYIGIILLLK